MQDFKLNKPRMHKPSEPDPAPDSAEYYNHVICEHGGLSLNVINRRKITVEVSRANMLKHWQLLRNRHQAAQLLQKLFPAWRPLSSDTEACAVCDAEIHISKEDRKESRRRVEDEKVVLFVSYPRAGPLMISILGTT